MLKDFLLKRRENFANQLNQGEMAIVFANGYQSYPRYFLQDRNFFYLTGLDAPNLILLVYKGKTKTEFIIFLERNIPERIVWEGKKLSKEEAQEVSGINSYKFADEFDRVASMYLYSANVCYVNNIKKALNSIENKSIKFVNSAKSTFPEIVFRDINKLMTPLRAVKDEWEIKELINAIKVTGKGIERILSKAKSGMYEYELEAMYLYEVYKHGLKHIGFKSIVAAGENATILHYEKNRSQVNKGDLVLLDIGALSGYYSADISRTFPIEKQFSPRQKDIYQGVLSVQKAIIEMIKPNVKIGDLQKKTKELLTQVLYDLKIIKKDDELTKYYMHGVSHHLGMDTHDIMPRESILQEGNVITVEPGLYIPQEKIGVRIEDDVLVTQNGYKVLSDMIPKEVEELEEFRKKI